MTQRTYGCGRLERIVIGGGKTAWQGIWTDAASRRHRKILALDQRSAERILADIVKKRDLIVAGLAHEEGQGTPLSKIIPAYLDELRTFRSAKYTTAVEGQLSMLMEDFGDRAVRDITPQMVQDRRRRRISSGSSLRTANAEVAAMKTALTWAARSGMIAVNPIANVVPVRATERDLRKKRRALTEDEIVMFLTAATAADEERARFYAAEKTIQGGTKGRPYADRERRRPIPMFAFWRFVISTGCRFSEAATLRWADFDEKAGVATVRADVAKGKRSRYIPVPEEVVTDLRRLREEHAVILGRVPSADDRVFLSPKGCELSNKTALFLFDEVLARTCIAREDAQGRSLDIHALRGTAATRMLRHNVNLATVAQILGHRDPRLTMKHYADAQIADAKAAVARMPRLG